MLTGIDPGDLDVDHASRDTKNNIDVRKATHSQNGANSNPKSHYRGRPTSSKYKGVMWNKRNKKWTATLTVNYKKHHLGYFSNELDAAKAYDQAALKFSGEFAALNRDLFPDDFL